MKHNVDFEGNVQSLGPNTEHGYATVGVITEGHYRFFSESEERVTILRWSNTGPHRFPQETTASISSKSVTRNSLLAASPAEGCHRSQTYIYSAGKVALRANELEITAQPITHGA